MQTDNETAEVSAEGDDDAIQALPAYLHLRGGVYYFKRKVPAKWKRLMETPKEEIWVSLETADLTLALKKHAMVLSDFEAEMKTCLAAPAANDRRSQSYRPRVQGTTQYLQEAHIPFLLDRYEYAHHTTGDEERSGAWDDELDEQLDFVTECRDALKRRARAAARNREEPCERSGYSRALWRRPEKVPLGEKSLR